MWEPEPQPAIAHEQCRGCLSPHQVKGDFSSAYVADETPMRTFVNTHAVLEARRVACREATASGQTGTAPVTMVVGPTDSGKSSLCKLLVNYSVRQVSAVPHLTPRVRGSRS